MSGLVDKLCNLYSNFDEEMLGEIGSIYSSDIQFKDPLHEVQGIDNLRRYFSGMIQGLTECQFEFDRIIDIPAQGECILLWTMTYRHVQLAGGNRLVLSGNSHLRYADRVYYHRDYFDAGAMLYEHIPLLGFAIRKIKTRLEVK